MEKKEHLCTLAGNVNWCSHYRKHRGASKKLKIELPHDLVIPLLVIHQKKKMKTLTQKVISNSMFIAALFVIVINIQIT